MVCKSFCVLGYGTQIYSALVYVLEVGFFLTWVTWLGQICNALVQSLKQNKTWKGCVAMIDDYVCVEESELKEVLSALQWITCNQIVYAICIFFLLKIMSSYLWYLALGILTLFINEVAHKKPVSITFFATEMAQ